MTDEKITTEKPIKVKKEKKIVVETPAQEKGENENATKELQDGTIKKNTEEKISETPEVKKEEKKKVEAKPVAKKTSAVVRGDSLPISMKHAMALCDFIKGKEIEKVIVDLQQVLKKKRAIPMKGELPHRRGNMMSGRYPQNATEAFILLLKSLAANARANGVDEPHVISAAKTNIAFRPYGRFGAHRKKRTHVELQTMTMMEGKK